MRAKPNKTPVQIPLRIMKKHLHDIVKGVQKTEVRQVNKFYIDLFMFTDGKGNVLDFRHITELRLYVGNAKDGEYAIVEVLEYGNIEYIDNIPDGYEKGDYDFYFDIGKIIKTNVSL